MPQSTVSPVTSETAALVRLIMSKLGQDGPITLGNPTTGESCPLPPDIADLIRQVLASLAAGHQVTITENLAELTPNEAAQFLNMSRTHVMKLVLDGTLPTRMVGNHHRIPYPDLAAYKDQQRARSRASMDKIYDIEREAAPTEAAPSHEVFKSGDGRGA